MTAGPGSAFVLAGGVPESGLERLAALLDRRPGIRCGPETSLFCHPALWRGGSPAFESLSRFLLGSHPARDGFVPWARPDERVLAEYGWTTGEVAQAASAASTVREFRTRFHARVASGTPPVRVVVDGAPQNLYAADAALESDPALKLVLTVRSGPEAAEAMFRRGVSRRIAASVWVFDCSLIHHVVRRHARSGRVRLVRYEDLISAPERVVSGLCDFLGVEREAPPAHPAGNRIRHHADRIVGVEREASPAHPAAGPPGRGAGGGRAAFQIFDMVAAPAGLKPYASVRRPVSALRLQRWFGYGVPGQLRSAGAADASNQPPDACGPCPEFERFYFDRVLTLRPGANRDPARRALAVCSRRILSGVVLAGGAVTTAGERLLGRCRAFTGKAAELRDRSPGALVPVAQYALTPLPPAAYGTVAVVAFRGRRETASLALAQMFASGGPDHAVGVVLSCADGRDVPFARAMRSRYGRVGIVAADGGPLGQQWQRAVDCARQAGPRYLLVAGEGDLVSADYVRNHARIMDDTSLGSIALAGPRTWYVLDPSRLGAREAFWKLSYRSRARGGRPLGAGRIYSRAFLDRVAWRIFDPRRDTALEDPGCERLADTNGLLYVSTLDDGFVLSVRDGGALRRVPESDDVVAEPASDAAVAGIRRGLDGAWNALVELGRAAGQGSGSSAPGPDSGAAR